MHKREMVLNKVIEILLENVAYVAERVYKGRVYPMDDAALPGLCVYAGVETGAIVTTSSPRVSQRVLTLTIEIYVKSEAEIPPIVTQLDELDIRAGLIVSQLNDIGLEIENAMSIDTSIDSLALDSWVSNYAETLSNNQADQAMKTMTGVGVVTYTIIYDIP